MKSPVPIMTSIPPNLNRQDPQGQQVGRILQSHCIANWKSIGFDVYSLNSAEEIRALEDAYPDVTFIEAKRDGRTITGRPLVYVEDVLHALRGVGQPVGGIVNSDIFFRVGPQFMEYVRDEAIGSCVFGRRVEVSQISQKTGLLYPMGLDYFFFDMDISQNLPMQRYMLGVPWWDYILPLLLFFRGAKMKRLDSHVAYHYTHPENWEKKQLRDFYCLTKSVFQKEADEFLRSNSGLSGAIGPLLWHILGQDEFRSRFYGVNNGSIQLTEDHIDVNIHAYASYCIEYLDHVSTSKKFPV